MKDYSSLVTDTWDFGSDKTLAENLLALVLAGKKTATTDMYVEGKKVPKADDYAAIVGADKRTACIIRYTKVEVKPFLEVDESYSRLEGESLADLEEWRKVHREFFTREYGAFNDSSLVICEQFELVQKIDQTA